MGVSALPDICEGLIGAGMEKDMPAAILQKGTTAGQKRIVATVSTLEEEVKRQGIETPAIIVVGTKAKIIISKSGELLSYEEYCKQMEEGR